ncbi:unnamed protein product [Mucor hiemalis]
MINRKTKRQSPPPYKTTTTIDQKQTDSFSKWTKVLQLLSPPHKKRRAFELLAQQDSDEDSVSTCSSKSSIDDDQLVPSPPLALKRERSMDQISQQKMLNRRAMYIPSTTTIITDGPNDSHHQWTLYCATHQKLRRTTLPLLESLHLRKMLNTLQHQLSRTIGHNVPNKENLIKQQEDEEDDIPLGALLEKNKKPVYNKKLNSDVNYKKMTIPPTSSIKAFYNNRRLMQPVHANKIPVNHFQTFPYYYYNRPAVQYI